MAGETVWLVYGEESVRHFLSQQLGVEGYAVLAFPDGESALQSFGATAHPRAVICEADTNGRGMDAADFYNAAAEALEGVPKYSVGVASSKKIFPLGDSGVKFVPMPINLGELVESLKRDMDGNAGMKGSEK